MSGAFGTLPSDIEAAAKEFIGACAAFADTLLHFHEILADGDLDVIQQSFRRTRHLDQHAGQGCSEVA